MATNSEQIEQQRFVYTSATRTNKTTTSKSRSRSISGSVKGRYRLARDFSLPRSSDSATATASAAAVARASAAPSPPLSPWSCWFRGNVNGNERMAATTTTTATETTTTATKTTGAPAQTMSAGSTDRVNDSVACEEQQRQQQATGCSFVMNGQHKQGQHQQKQQQQQAPAVVRRNQRQAKRVSLSQNDLQQQPLLEQQQLCRQYHDKSSNNNNNNDGKVRLLITPATAMTAKTTTTPTTPTGKPKYGNKQQMVRSATATFATVDSPQHQRSQQTPTNQHQSRQRNYHHYDYYTDSDLASSLLASQTAANNNGHQHNGSHYDENLLLFATEHSANVNAEHNQNQQQGSNGNQQQQQQLSHGLHGSSSMGATGSQRNLHSNALATGKFVSSYPSWRQTQLSPAGHHQNYSFHVPLNQPAPPQLYHQGQHSQQQQPQQVCKSRYGFVTVTDRVVVPTGGRFSGSLRPRTIGHLPGMVKVNVGDSSSNSNFTVAADASSSSRQQEAAAASTDAGAKGDRSLYANGDGTGGSNYEDFYERPSIASKQHIMMSEGDLLQVHVADYKSAPFPHGDYGCDNPFKPGTELSWEADMMVRLMKRGYPIKELPVLVETAKQVAKEIGSPTHSEEAVGVRRGSLSALTAAASSNSSNSNNNNIGKGGEKYSTTNTNGQGRLANTNEANQLQQVPRKQETLQRRQQAHDRQQTNSYGERRQSSSDLRSGKQIWANSLSRAKSMPRFYTSQADDADSIDKLITSIENEMSDLLQQDLGDQQEQRGQRRKGSTDKVRAASNISGEFDSDQGKETASAKERPATPLAITTKQVPTSGRKTKLSATCNVAGKGSSKKRAEPLLLDERQQVTPKTGQQPIASGRRQQRRKGSNGSIGDQNDNGDLSINNNKKKHKRDFECCMIQ